MGNQLQLRSQIRDDEAHHQQKYSVSGIFFPESVWAKGSSNSGGLSNIFTYSHLHITSSSLYIFPSSHLHTCSSSHLLIFTSVHLHICSSSHLFIFTSCHLHILTSSHLHICSSSHLHIFTFSLALLLFCPLASSRLQLTSSHLLIFTSSHLHIFTSSHLHILSCPLALLPSCSLLLFHFSLEGAGQCQRDGTKRNPFARNEVRSPKTEVNLRFLLSVRNPFARNEVRSPKTEVKCSISRILSQRFSSVCKSCLCVKVSVCKSIFASKRLCVKSYV